MYFFYFFVNTKMDFGHLKRAMIDGGVQTAVVMLLVAASVVMGGFLYFESEPFDSITSRAFATLKDMVDGSIHLLKDDGYFYAMKGLYPTEEIGELDNRTTVVDCFALHVPGEEAERHLVKIQKSGV